MNQPPYSSPPPPSQPPQVPYNPYNQPVPPQQPQGFAPMPAPGQPPMHSGPPPVHGQAPTHPAPPFQAPPFGQRPSTAGNPVGAVFLGFVVSVVVSLLYSGIILTTYKEQSLTTANILYVGHAVLNGAVVGSLVGLVGHRSNGARIGAAVIAALGAFFGFTNSLPLIIADSETPRAAWDLLQHDPFWPAKAWWNSETGGGVDWVSPLGLVIAAAAAWGLAHVVGNKRGRT